MISHELKCIFIHISRNGGKSIEKAIWDVDPVHGSADHARIRYWQKKLNRKIFENYFKFTFCRNPWDRMVSLYSYYKQNLDEYLSQRKGPSLEMMESFENFVKLPKRVSTQLSYIKG